MNNQTAVDLLSVLGSGLRLAIFRILLQAGKDGLNPKYISDKLSIKPNKLSFHLNSLKKHNLVNNKKNGRELIYFANYKTIPKSIRLSFENCCKGNEGECIGREIDKK